jgi:hypothetical protein
MRDHTAFESRPMKRRGITKIRQTCLSNRLSKVYPVVSKLRSQENVLTVYAYIGQVEFKTR